MAARLNWTTPPDGGAPITSYNVERRRLGGDFLPLTTTQAGYPSTYGVRNITTYLDTGSQSGDQYRVQAVNAAGSSAWSNVASAPVVSAAGDDFNRSDAATLGPNWTVTHPDAYGISGGQAAALTSFGMAARYTTVPTGDTTWAELRWRTTDPAGTFAGPAVNMPTLGSSLAATNPFYVLSVSGSMNSLSIRRKTEGSSGTTSMLSVTLAAPIVSGDVLRLESTPTELIGYVNGVERIKVAKSAAAALPDPTVKGVGFWSTNAATRFDDFTTAGGEVVTAPPGTTTLAAASSINSGGFTSTWTAATNATDYLVQRRVSGGSFETIATSDDTTHVHTGLVSGTTYEVRIIPRNGLVEGAASNTVTATTSAAVTPGTPTLAMPATNISSSGFTSTWTAAANATDYLVQRRTGSNAFATVSTTTNLSYIHSGLLASTTYDVRIIARAGTTQGVASNVVSTATTAATTNPTPTPTGQFLIGLTAAQIQSLSTSTAGWTNILTESGSASTPLAVDMGVQDSMTASQAVACGIRYVRTGDVGYKNKVIAGCEAVRNWSGYTHRTMYNRGIAGWALAADLVGHSTSAWMTYLDTIRFRSTYDNNHSRWNQMYKTAWDSANNHGTLAAASFLAASLAIGDDARITEAVGWVKAYNGDFSQHITHPNPTNPTPGGFSPLTNTVNGWMSPRTPWQPLNPTSAPVQLEGAWNQDIDRDNATYTGQSVPVWGADGQAYTEAAAAGFMLSAMLCKANGLLPDVWDRSNQGFRRWRAYLARYGTGSHKYPNVTGWIDPVVNHVYGTSYSGVDIRGWSFTGSRFLSQSSTWLK